MSEQTPLEKKELPSSNSHIQIRKKQNSIFGFFRFLIAAAFVVGGVWLGQQKLDFVPVWSEPFIVPVSIALALLVFVVGNFGRLTEYVSASVKEVKKVVWPERAYTIRMTVFVIIFVAIMAAFIYIVDTAISWLFFDLLLKRG